jgi:hypothetical protein
MRIMIGNDGGTSDHNDTVDIVFQSVQKTITNKDDEGKIITSQVMDDLALWCKTLTVSSNKFAQLIFEAMEYVRSGMSAKNNMCSERAAIWEQETIEIFESIKKACDAKSSESIRDHDNSQSTMIDKINRNSVEKIFTMKENSKKSLWSSIMGKEKDKYTDED